MQTAFLSSFILLYFLVVVRAEKVGGKSETKSVKKREN